MTSPAELENDEYRLQRHVGASARLNLQHFLFKDTLGYLLHPDIPVHPNMKIADVATGTGIWLLDVSRVLPSSVTLKGYDISSDQFPSESILPSNISFGTFDATAGIPDDLVGKFDVVRVALLVAVVQGGDPSSWIQNLMKMLKPGGHLVWMEGSVALLMKRCLEDPLDRSKFPALAEFETEGLSRWKAMQWRMTWIAELGHYFEKCGFEKVKYEQRDAEKVLWRAFTDNTILIQEEMMSKAGDEKAIKKLEGMKRDVRNGAIWPGVMPAIAVGQKPS